MTLLTLDFKDPESRPKPLFAMCILGWGVDPTHTPWKFNSSPLKTSRAPKEDHLPSIHLSGAMLNFGGVLDWKYIYPTRHTSRMVCPDLAETVNVALDNMSGLTWENFWKSQWIKEKKTFRRQDRPVPRCSMYGIVTCLHLPCNSHQLVVAKHT